MNGETLSVIFRLLAENEESLLERWLAHLRADPLFSEGVISAGELAKHCGDFLRALREATQVGNLEDMKAPEWDPVRQVLADISGTWTSRGFGPLETATFVFSLKKPLFELLMTELGKEPTRFCEEVWRGTELLNRLGLFTVEIYIGQREEIIERQRRELMELSTPVVKLWEGILALPVIGTLDSARTQVMMENLLESISTTGSRVAIIDITGVPLVDTLVAQHLLKTISAARLMGTECIISGIRPQIAQTVVNLGLSLADVVTKATLAEAFALALERTGFYVRRGEDSRRGGEPRD